MAISTRTQIPFEELKPDRFLEEARKRNLITPFQPGTVISENSLVIDRNGVAWWVRPGAMAIIPAGPPTPFPSHAEAADQLVQAAKLHGNG